MKFGAEGCPRCQGDGYAIAPAGEFAAATVCSCVPLCERCGGSGRVLVEQDGVRRAGRCRCQMLPDRIRLYAGAQIPSRLAHASFKSFEHASGESTRSMSQVMRWLDRFPEERRGTVLYGDVGRGKSHLLVASIRVLIFDHGIQVRFVEFTHLLAELREGFSSGKGQEGTLAPLLEVGLLAIDELGRGRHTEWELTIIDTLISRRYNALMPVVCTTNFVPGPPTGRTVENLATPGEALRIADRVGPRVYSRLREMCSFLEIAGPDYRQREQRWR